jgi:hypothetical protein
VIGFNPYETLAALIVERARSEATLKTS